MKLSRKVVFIVSIASAIGAETSRGQAQAAQTPAESIVAVSFNSVVLQTNEAQRDLGALDAKYAPRRAQVQVLNDKVEASRKDLAENGDKLSDQERASRTRALSAQEKQLERAAEDFRNDSQTEAQQAFERIAQKVFIFLQEYARKHDYTAIIDRGSDTAPFVWYAAENADITTQVVKAYNAQSGVPAPDSTRTPAIPNVGPGTSGKPAAPDTPKP